MAKKVDIRTKLIQQAMTLAAERGWRDLSMVEIAEASGFSLSQVYAEFRTKQEVLAGFSRMIDADVLAEGPAEAEDGPARDRLFDVVMRRFDALSPYRDALGHIAYDQLRDPLAACSGARELRRSMALMLETARIGADGIRGALRIKGLTAIYLVTLRVWLRDDSADMAKTMATLDGYLRRIEGLAERVPSGFTGRFTGGGAAAA